MAAKVRVALLGAGNWAQVWIQQIRDADDVELMAVWSRSAESAEAARAAVADFAPGCASHHGEAGLQALLASTSVQAVILSLPCQAQPPIIEAALHAGKHVLSEKPVAPTLESARQLLALHASLPAPKPLWCVAENWRSIPALLALRGSLAAGALGRLVRLEVAADMCIPPGSKYHGSAWRRDEAALPGGFITDSAVHFMAALRMAAQAAGWGEPVAASAVGSHACPSMPAPDSISGTLHFGGGGGTGGEQPPGAAAFSMTLSAGLLRVSLGAVGTQGTAEAVRGGLGGNPRTFRLRTQLVGEREATEEETSADAVGIELRSFARLVRAAAGLAAEAGQQKQEESAVEVDGLLEEDARRLCAVEATRDLAAVLALVRSAAAGGAVVAVEAVDTP